MRRYDRMVVLAVVLFGLASPLFAQGTAGMTSASGASIAKALDDAMTPGEGQQKLTPMVGTFDVRILTWADPSKPPSESPATAVSTWVLGNRYVQMMLAGYVEGEPFSGIGYMAYDNASRMYEAAWMDTGSTGMAWYRGELDPTGKRATMKGSVTNPVSGKPSPVELRLTIDAQGGHVTEIWGMGLGDTMFKMMELRYTRKSQ